MGLNFQRTKFRAYAKLGAGQKSKRKYRRAKGEHNKTRQKWKSRPRRVEIGYKGEAVKRGLIRGKLPVVIKNAAELGSLKENEIAVLGKIGLKKRIELARDAEKKKIRFENLNTKRFLRKIKRLEERKKKLREEKEGKREKRKAEEKKQEDKTKEKKPEK